MSFAKMWIKNPSYDLLCDYLKKICGKYGFISYISLGESICNREIPMLSIGNTNASKSTVYVGTHHALEWVTTAVLLRFIEDFAESYNNGSEIYGIDLNRMFDERRITVIPMLNPDGFELHTKGMSNDFILRERLMKLCGGDFSH